MVVLSLCSQAIAVLVGLCFSDAIELSQRGVQAMQGVIFLIVSENTFLPMYAALSLFPERFPLFQREKKANLYSTAQFYISTIMSMVRVTAAICCFLFRMLTIVFGLVCPFHYFPDTVRSARDVRIHPDRVLPS